MHRTSTALSIILSMTAVSCVDGRDDSLDDISEEVSHRAGDVECVKLAFVDPNPQDFFGLPPEWRRSFAVSAQTCNDPHWFKVHVFPSDGGVDLEALQFKGSIITGDCYTIGGPLSGAEHELVMGQGETWEDLLIVVEVDGEYAKTYHLPLMINAADKATMGDPPVLDHRPVFFDGNEWVLEQPYTAPHCI